MDVQEEVKRIEKELVERIVAHLQANKIAVETARQQAQDFLSLLPVQDQKDLLNKLKNLGEKYEEAKAVYAEELGKSFEAVRLQTLDQMRGFIQAGNIDAAIAAAKAIHPPKEQKNDQTVQPVPPAVQPTVAPQSITQLPIQPSQPVQQGQLPVVQKGGN